MICCEIHGLTDDVETDDEVECKICWRIERQREKDEKAHLLKASHHKPIEKKKKKPWKERK